MSYTEAKQKAFSEIENLSLQKNFSVKFLVDEYEINVENKSVLSLSGNVPTPEYLAVLILHYLIKRIEGLLPLKNEWINFRQLSGGKGYYPVFYQRVIEPIKRKYGRNTRGLLTVLDRFNGKKTNYGDASVEITTFENVPLLIVIWSEDKEFPSEANILFDRSIEEILSTEDIVILAEFITHSL